MKFSSVINLPIVYLARQKERELAFSVAGVYYGKKLAGQTGPGISECGNGKGGT
jgi:hypothetical protein